MSEETEMEPGKGGAGKEIKPSTAYLDARRKWYERTGDLMSQKAMWQVIAMLSLFAALASLGGLIILSVRSQFVPYVVEVDRLGQPAAIARADVAEPVQDRVVIHLLASFITDARTVTLDDKGMEAAVWRVYALLRSDDPASIKMTDYYQDRELSPLHRPQGETTSIEVVSVLRQNEQTWEVSWYEQNYTNQGGPKGSRLRMRALLNVYIQPPTSTTTEAEIRANPLGVFVRDFSWGAALEPERAPVQQADEAKQDGNDKNKTNSK